MLIRALIVFIFFYASWRKSLNRAWAARYNFTEISTAKAGESKVLPHEVYTAISSLQERGETCFSLNGSFLNVDLLKQRMIEGAFPIKYDKQCTSLVSLRVDVKPEMQILWEHDGVTIASYHK